MCYTHHTIYTLLIPDTLYAFSPGLWSDGKHAWTLVAVDTKNGTVTKKCEIAPAGKKTLSHTYQI